MAFLRIVSDIATILMLGVLSMALICLVRMRRAFTGLVSSIGDRQVEIRLDLQDAAKARANQHKENAQVLSNAAADLKRIADLFGALVEACKHPQDRTTIEVDVVLPDADAESPETRTPTVRASNQEVNAVREAKSKESDSARPSQTDTVAWDRPASLPSLFDVGISHTSAGEAVGLAGTSPARGRSS